MPLTNPFSRSANTSKTSEPDSLTILQLYKFDFSGAFEELNWYLSKTPVDENIVYLLIDLANNPLFLPQELATFLGKEKQHQLLNLRYDAQILLRFFGISDNVYLHPRLLRLSRALNIVYQNQFDPTLKSINLSSISIDSQYAPYIFGRLRTPESLDLSQNNLDADVATIIAKFLENNKTLKSFHLYYNSIGKGATAIAKSLENNTTLISIYLDNNAIPVESAKAFIILLEKNTTLEYIALSGNKLPDDILNTIERLLQRNREMKPAKIPAILALARAGIVQIQTTAPLPLAHRFKILKALTPELTHVLTELVAHTISNPLLPPDDEKIDKCAKQLTQIIFQNTPISGPTTSSSMNGPR